MNQKEIEQLTQVRLSNLHSQYVYGDLTGKEYSKRKHALISNAMSAVYGNKIGSEK